MLGRQDRAVYPGSRSTTLNKIPKESLFHSPIPPIGALSPSRRRLVEVLAVSLILLSGLLLRLHEVTAPPVDFLSWRDTQTLMVARNFYREGMNLFRPAVDWRNSSVLSPTGTVGGTELPVVPYLTAALYFVFGIQYWVGRVVPIAFALIGTGFFYLLVRRFYGTACAALSALLLNVSPYYLYCGRLQMPEPFAYAMSFAALYYFDVWLASERRWRILPTALFTALTLLGKPQLAIILVTMAFLAFHRFGVRAFITPRLYVFAAMAAVPVAAWMAWSYLVLIPVSGLSFAQSSLLGYRKYLTDPRYYIEIAKAVWRVALTPPVVVLAFIGLLPGAGPKSFRTYETRPRDFFVHAWAAGALSFFFLMPGGNIVNGYYHLVLAPPAVILASRALRIGIRSRALSFVTGAIVLALSGYCLYVATGFYRPYHASAQHCGTWIDQHTPRSTLVLTASRDPATLYFADRVGWTSWRETFSMDLIDKVVPLGASVLAVSEESVDNSYYPQYRAIRDELYERFFSYNGDDFVVFSLRNAADLSLPSDGRVTFGTPESRKYLRGTWGPNQVGTSGLTFVAMGPSSRAAITFTAEAAPNRIVLGLSSTAPDQGVSLELNGQQAVGLTIPKAFERGAAVIDVVADIPSAGGWTLNLEATRQNESAASLLLYSLEVIR